MTADVEITEASVANVGAAVAVSSSKEELDRIARMGMWLAAAESGSKDPNALGMAAALRMAYADSLGLPAHAASEVHIIKGNLSISAKMCRALAHPHGLRVIRVEDTDESCTAAVIVEATGKELGRSTFTMEDARRAGLDKPSASGRPSNYVTIPRRMLWARASKQVLDDFAPYVTVGVLASEQIVESFPDDPVPFDSDEVLQGEIVEDNA